MRETVSVGLEGRDYEIHVGSRLLQQAGGLIGPFLRHKRALIVTDENVARFYLHRLTGALEDQGIGARAIVLPAGEQTKSFVALEGLLENILEQKPDRSTVLIALGGGVIGDITGFAASVVLRGIGFVQIPTTLLAQVDSSVGGKTGINSRFGKNLIGSFHQPKLVLADVDVLASLPQRELKAGYVEVVKYGLINNPGFFSWLEENGAKMLAGDKQALTHAVKVSCQAKAAIVAADEHETKDLRALLNLGHTFAHALEAETGYGDVLLHGEAVAIGMHMAFALSVRMGMCPAKDLERIDKHYQAVGLMRSPLDVRAQWQVEALMEHFTRDKKAESGTLTFVLADGIGKARVVRGVDKNKVNQLVAEYCAAG